MGVRPPVSPIGLVEVGVTMRRETPRRPATVGHAVGRRYIPGRERATRPCPEIRPASQVAAADDAVLGPAVVEDAVAEEVLGVLTAAVTSLVPGDVAQADNTRPGARKAVAP